MTPVPEATRPEGSFYACEDYAGFFRRAASGAVDGLVLWASFLAFSALIVVVRPPALAAAAVVSAWMSTVYGYLAVLKRTRFRTLGYWLAGIKVVDLRGRSPSIGAMCLRCSLLVVAPAFLPVDFFYLLGDRQRRKITDTVAGTRVVRAAARPVDQGDVVLSFFFVLGHAYVHRDIRPIVRSARRVEGTS